MRKVAGNRNKDSRINMKENTNKRESVVTGLDGQIRIGGMEFCLWLASLGKGRTVGWKWRKEGRVKCENIDGRLFIRQEEIDRFWARAKAGEFPRKTAGVCKPGKPGLN